MSNLRDTIWLTWKTRTFSERRYRTYDVASNLVQAYMAVLMLAASIFADELKQAVPYFDKITVVLALFLFASSLVLYGFRFVETANRHRDCYLKLHMLEMSFDKQSDPASTYYEILAQYPNHATRDYEDFVLNRTLFGNEKIQIGGTPRSWSAWMLASKIIRLAVFWFLILFLPAATTVAFVWPFLRVLLSQR